MPNVRGQSQAFSDPPQPEAMWLVFAKGRAPSYRLGMTKAPSGTWWRKVATEKDAIDLVARLKTSGMVKVWYRYELDLPERSQPIRGDDRDFARYKKAFKQPTTIAIALDPERDRSSGRPGYHSITSRQIASPD
jgi:hypothetical protein